MSSSNSSDCVQVAVRVRPLVKSETSTGCQNIVRKSKNEPQIIIGEGRNNEVFTFNHVFAPEMPQEMVYTHAIKGMLGKLFEGYNVTILAYGQTGSGKTHTMGTNNDGTEEECTRGVIPRAMHDIFEKIETTTTHNFDVTCSFIELYQENLYDLLSNRPREESVMDIREDANKEIVIPGLTEIAVRDAAETTECQIRGSLRRATGATAMNAESSRSHAIFTLILRTSEKGDEKTATTSKFHLVDLAGSERSKKTKATGIRFDEGVKINQGLLALGNVISALGGTSTSGHIKYRDSKLTRLLQDSLGGNSVTLMIACVSPADYNYDETISTLRYADRAKKIKNKPIVNQDPHVAEIKRLNAQICSLQMLLYGGHPEGSKERLDAVNLRKKRVSAVFSPAGKMMVMKNMDSNRTEEAPISLEQQRNLLAQKCRKLEMDLENALNDVTNIEIRSIMAEETMEKSLQKLKMLHDLVNSSANSAVDQNVEKILQLVQEMEEIFAKYTEENKNNQLTCHSPPSTPSSPTSQKPGERDSMSSHEIVRDRHISKQVKLTNELRQVMSCLALKEQLLSYVVERQDLPEDPSQTNNATSIDLLDASYNEKIHKLEEELKEAKERERKIKTSQISAKIAEERRKKVVELEQKLTALKLQNRKQTKELQALGSKDKQVQTLTQEIKVAKQERVRLVKEMRTEADKFRRTQQDLTKEVNRIKEEDRKLKNEMIRKQKLHERQINVQKRKYDEVAMLNKRYKDAQDRQVKAKAQRNERKGHKKDFKSIVDHELEVFCSVIDSKATMEHLIRERGELTQKLQQLKEEAADEDPTIGADCGDSTKEQIRVLEDDIFLKNENIKALREKIPTDEFVQRQSNELNENILTLMDSKLAIHHLVEYVARIQQCAQDEKLQHVDTRSTLELVQDQNQQFMAKYQELQQAYDEKNRQVEKSYEDKLSLLLVNVNQRKRKGVKQEIVDNDDSNGSRQMIEAAADEHLEALRDELDEYKQKFAELQLKYQQKTGPKKKVYKRIQEISDSEDEFSISDDEFNDSNDDPSWRKTPMGKRQPKRNASGDTSNNTSAPQPSDTSSRKRGSDGQTKCKCKTGCATKKCSCKNLGAHCSISCGCKDTCVNRPEADDERTDEDKLCDATFKVPAVKIDDWDMPNVTFTVPETPENDENNENTLNEITPKKAKLSESDKMDVTTPQYVYATKKRKPFFES